MTPGNFTPPENLDAEQAVIGAILHDNRNFAKVAPFLHGDDFSFPMHRTIFDACAAIIESGQKANAVTLKNHVGGDWADVGGPGYLAGMVAAVPDMQAAEDYGRAVHDMAVRRRLRDLGLWLADNACDIGNGLTAEELAGQLLGHAQDSCVDTTIRTLKDRRGIMSDNVEALRSPARCFSTGIPRLDYCMGGGMFVKRAYGVAARRKAGKTIMAGTISHNMNAAGVRHLFICAEMSPQEIEHRGMARDMGINPIEFLKPANEEFVARVASVARLSPSNMFYLEAPGIKFTDLKRAVATAVSQHKITGFILDHLQLVEGKPARQSTAEFLDEVAQWCANFCRKEGLWSLVMMQLNADDNTRGGEAPTLAFDQVYKLKRSGEPDDPGPEAWLECFVSRYTLYNGVGTEAQPGLYLEPKGLYFRPNGEPPPMMAAYGG